MGKFRDLTGQTFGRLTVLYKLDKKSTSGKIMWRCKCSCDGKEIDVIGNSLVTGNTKSCGCIHSEQLADRNSEGMFVGKRYYFLEALEKTNSKDESGVIWRFRCHCCGREDYFTTPKKLSGQKSCGCLKTSAGEKLINKYLSLHNIEFEQEKTFDNCINPQTGCKLRFDFYLPKYNCCIEYDGEQHFFFDDRHWNTKSNFIETKYRDEIKNNFCKETGITLVRIPYTELEQLSQKDDYLLKILEEIKGE